MYALFSENTWRLITSICLFLLTKMYASEGKTIFGFSKEIRIIIYVKNVLYSALNLGFQRKRVSLKLM